MEDNKKYINLINYLKREIMLRRAIEQDNFDSIEYHNNISLELKSRLTDEEIYFIDNMPEINNLAIFEHKVWEYVTLLEQNPDNLLDFKY